MGVLQTVRGSLARFRGPSHDDGDLNTERRGAAEDDVAWHGTEAYDQPPAILEASGAAARMAKEASKAEAAAEAAVLAEIDRRLAILFQRVASRRRREPEGKKGDHVSDVLANLINLSPDIRDAASLRLLAAYELAITELLSDPPNAKASQLILHDLQRRLQSPLKHIVLGLTTLAYVLFSLPFVLLFFTELFFPQQTRPRSERASWRKTFLECR